MHVKGFTSDLPLATAADNGKVVGVDSNGRYILETPSSGGAVASVTGLNTDNADPTNPVVEISVDNTTVTGAGTPGSPLTVYAPGIIGGSPTQVQYHDPSNLFAGIPGSAVDSAKKLVGFNKATPLASVHAGTNAVTFPAPSGSIATAVWPTSSGFAFSQGSLSYNVYAAGLINGVLTYSSSYDSPSVNAPNSALFDPSYINASISYGSGNYTANGDSFTYRVWAVKNGAKSLIPAVSGTPTDDSSTNPYSVTLNWGAPSGLTPDGYVVGRTWSVNGYEDYVNLGNTLSLNDDGTGWGGSPGYPDVCWTVHLVLGAVTGVTNYITFNAPYSTWIDTGGTNTFDDLNNFPNSGAPTVTPNTYKYTSLISDGDTQLVEDGVSNFSIFNGTGNSGPFAGDMVQGWLQFGFGTSPFVLATSVQYENGQVLESGHALYDFSGNYFADSGGGLTANTGLYCPSGTGVDSNGKATWNGIKDTTLTADTPVFVNSAKQLISINNSLMQQVFGY